MYLTDSPLASVRVSDLNSSHIDLWIDWMKNHPKVDHKKRKSFIAELKILGHIFIGIIIIRIRHLLFR